MNRFEIFKDLYYKQIEQKEILRTNAISIPVTLLTGLCAILFYFLINFSYAVCTWLNIIFILTVCTCGIFVFISSYFLALSYNNLFEGRKYKYLGDADSLHRYYKKLREYRLTELKETPEIAEKAFEDYMTDAFVTCATHNEQQNDIRGNLISKANQYLILALVALFFTTIPYIGDSVLKKRKKIEEKTVILELDSIQNLA